MFKVCEGYVALIPIKEEEKVGGIYVVKKDNEAVKGKVVSVYDKYAPIRRGDVVLYKKFAGDLVEYKGKQYLIIEEKDLLGVYGSDA